MCVGGVVVVVECEYGHRGVLIQLVACRLVDHCAKPCDMHTNLDRTRPV